MPGIISGALGGAGDAMVKFGLQQQSAANAMDLENLRTQNEQNRAIALEKARISLGNQQREDLLQRRDTAKAGIIDAALGDRYATPVAGDTPLTPEQQAAQSEGLQRMESDKGRDRRALEKDPRTDLQASVQIGETSPKDAVAATARDDATATRMAIAEMRMEALNARTQAQYETAMAKVEAALAKASGSKEGNKEALSFIDGLRKDVASEASNLKALYAAEIKDKPRSKVAEIEATYKPRFAALEKRRSQIQRDFNAIRERVGLPPAAEEDGEQQQPAAAPAPANRPPLSSFMK